MPTAEIRRPDGDPNDLLGRAYAGAAVAGDAHVLRWENGSVTPLALGLWAAEAAPADLALLTRAHEPVLDVGCGPGRHVAALGVQGTTALGIDVL
ncbi:MAG TPA: hypothetical protein VN238_09380, partial [Solirubrobacteraceae bacterium]|nr:hypothetical protein [Solirubrobacteraceae bacterium]